MFRVLAFTVKPRESADTRYRILQYHAVAERDGIFIDHRSLMGPKYFRWQIQNVHLLLRLVLYPLLLLVRLWQVLFLAPRYDAVWISREMAPLGPPVLERLLLARCRKVILDIDDALHISDRKSHSFIPSILRDRGKFSRMAARYTAVVCGNKYLADFYRVHSAAVQIIPTVVEIDRYEGLERIPAEIVRIGWIGTPLNGHHLEALYTPLAALARERDFELVIVGLNKPVQWDLPRVRYIDWQLADEFGYFAQFDIGIMPLTDSPFARGKCAFKIIQYLAAGLPVVASPVGANCEVVEHGRNGYLAATQDDWHSLLRQLVDEPEMRRRMGEYGRDVVQRFYSVEAVWPRYAALLRGAACSD